MKRIYLLICIVFLSNGLHAQVCGTAGLDGPMNISTTVNTYFPAVAEVVLPDGSRTVNLAAVPVADLNGNNFGTKPIIAGDLLLIIQMQDAVINYNDNAFYGANNDKSGPDMLGGTGYTDLGNSGKFEYVIATNSVPLTGGILTFKGSGTGRGTIYSYVNAAGTATRGTRTFQVVRVPQYSNLTLLKNINTPPFNGKAGGIIAFDVAGTMDLNGFSVNASASGFAGGYGWNEPPGSTGLYVFPYSNRYSAGKGEGIAGTPQAVQRIIGGPLDRDQEGLPGGSSGKGAPANAGGGGMDYGDGGGGGGNGGAGGIGGKNKNTQHAGRPGSAIYGSGITDLARLMMGGGGGSGHAWRSQVSSFARKGGPGGGIVLINAGSIKGSGSILANGDNPAAAAYPGSISLANGAVGSAGGGGAGGTVFIYVGNPDPSAMLTIEAKGGSGGVWSSTTDSVKNVIGGGGGGGQVFYNMSPTAVIVSVDKGKAGVATDGIARFAADGQDGNAVHFDTAELPPYLQGRGCYPELTTVMSAVNAAIPQYPGAGVTYKVKVSNKANGGNAGMVKVDVRLPAGFSLTSASAVYAGDSGGPDPAVLTNLNTNANRPQFGGFNISPGDSVIITLKAKIDCGTVAGTYHSSAQASYVDPSRTINDPDRSITAFINAFPGAKTAYETGLSTPVPGSNYNGNLPGSNKEDVKVITVVITDNHISAPQTTVFCTSGNPSILIGAVPVSSDGAGFTYRWQQSADNLTFNDIPAAVSKDFDPPEITDSVYYRRIAIHPGCMPPDLSNTILIRIINPLPVVDFEMPKICLGDGLAKFINKTTVADGADIRLTYLWDFGDPGSANPTSAERDGSHVYTRADHYTVRLTVFREGACPQFKEYRFTVNGSSPKAGFTIANSNHICSGTEVKFKDNATVDFGELTKIEWYYDYDHNSKVPNEIDEDPSKRGGSVKAYTHSYPVFHSPATLQVNVRMVVYSGTSCYDGPIVPITLNAKPEVFFDTIPPMCSSVAAFKLTQGREIHGVLTGEGHYSGDGVSTDGVFDPAAAGPGTHTLTYTFIADNLCEDSQSREVTVYPIVVVDAGKDEVILEGGEVELKAIASVSTGAALKYKWTPATGLDRDDVLHPRASPDRDITYKLTVSLEEGGCEVPDEVSVTVLRNPEIPNAFSPNGDGVNDEWNIKYLSSYPDATVEVYNRYGEKVMSMTAGQASWDGKCNGVNVPAGTYYYILDPHNGRKIITGALSVLR